MHVLNIIQNIRLDITTSISHVEFFRNLFVYLCSIVFVMQGLTNTISYRDSISYEMALKKVGLKHR